MNRLVITGMLWLLMQATPVAAEPPGTDAAIAERLAPVGSLCLEGDDCGVQASSASSGPRDGADVYGSFCFACHSPATAAALKAPAFGDASQWEPRIAKGMDALLQSVFNGLPPGMPPKGTCMDCTDDELKAALEHMVEASKP